MQFGRQCWRPLLPFAPRTGLHVVFSELQKPSTCSSYLSLVTPALSCLTRSLLKMSRLSQSLPRHLFASSSRPLCVFFFVLFQKWVALTFLPWMCSVFELEVGTGKAESVPRLKLLSELTSTWQNEEEQLQQSSFALHSFLSFSQVHFIFITRLLNLMLSLLDALHLYVQKLLFMLPQTHWLCDFNQNDNYHIGIQQLLLSMDFGVSHRNLERYYRLFSYNDESAVCGE